MRVLQEYGVSSVAVEPCGDAEGKRQLSLQDHFYCGFAFSYITKQEPFLILQNTYTDTANDISAIIGNC